MPLAALLAAVIALAGCGADDDPVATTPSVTGAAAPPAKAAAASTDRVLTGTLPLLNGEPQDLSDYRGKVVLVVNTATECGFTPQFEGLEDLYRSRRGDGFVILGFPADDVAHQEPRDDQQIAEFCKENFGVSFPMFAKSNVVSEPLNPVFERLDALAGPPGWNFNKYLLDRDGEVVQHYDVSTEPDDAGLNAKIDQLLAS